MLGHRNIATQNTNANTNRLYINHHVFKFLDWSLTNQFVFTLLSTCYMREIESYKPKQELPSQIPAQNSSYILTNSRLTCNHKNLSQASTYAKDSTHTHITYIAYKHVKLWGDLAKRRNKVAFTKCLNCGQ